MLILLLLFFKLSFHFFLPDLELWFVVGGPGVLWKWL